MRRTRAASCLSASRGRAEVADLPKPDVSVDVTPTPDGSAQGVVINVSRDNKSYDGALDKRAWSGHGRTVGEAVKGAVEKMLSDPRTGEYISK